MGWLGDWDRRGRLPRFWPAGGRWLNSQRRIARRARMRAATRPVYLGDHDVLCTVLARYKMYVDSRDMSLAPHLMLDGIWEMWVTEALAELLRPAMICADVGANVGYFTLIMADLCRNGHVHAFEPNPNVAARLRRTLIINGMDDRTTLHPDPLGEEEGRAAHLVVPAMQDGGSHLVDVAQALGRAGVPVEIRRLDGIAGAREAELVKIDAEGSESAIWRGMAGMIGGTRLATVLLEFTPARHADPRAFLSELAAAGFALGYVHESRGMLSATADEVLNDRSVSDRMLLLRR